VAAPSLPAAEASSCSRLLRPSHATNLLLLVPALPSQIPPAPVVLLSRVSRHSRARRLQSARLQIQVLAEFFLRRERPPPLPSYPPMPPARPGSSTPGYLLFSISTDADYTCQMRRPLRGARPPAARPHFSKSQSEPNRA